MSDAVHVDHRERADLGLIPFDIQERLLPEQVGRLHRLLMARGAEHAIDYRVSTSVFGRSFYLAVLAGGESRSLRRLLQDGQKRSFTGVAFDVVVACFALSLLVCMVTGLVVIAGYIGVEMALSS